MATVLSTKKLAINQKELLLNAGIGLVEYDAISIEFINFKINKAVIANAIFTSKNAVKAILKKDVRIEKCFCVGEKTAALARKNDFSVIEVEANARDLANRIIEKYKDKEFQFFSGNKRREELPEMLKKNKINYKETTVYKTGLNTKRFESEFDGILFFSPSAVQSFIKENQLKTIAFCIGETTSAEARKHTETIITASNPAIENVIVKVVSKLKGK